MEDIVIIRKKISKKKLKYFQNTAEGRWFKMSLCEQLGNIGSEAAELDRYFTQFALVARLHK